MTCFGADLDLGENHYGNKKGNRNPKRKGNGAVR